MNQQLRERFGGIDRLYGSGAAVAQDIGAPVAGAPEDAPAFTAERDGTLTVAGRSIGVRVLPDTDPQVAAGRAPERRVDGRLVQDFRARSSSVYHGCGTCRMAPEQAGGVVGPDLSVYGIEGLRVADASIFPNISSANTNAPTILVAHKAAQAILAQRRCA